MRAVAMWTLKSGHGRMWEGGRPTGPTPWLRACSPSNVGPLIAARGLGLWGALKLHQRVRAEPGCQTPSGAFSSSLDAVFGKHFHAICPWYFFRGGETLPATAMTVSTRPGVHGIIHWWVCICVCVYSAAGSPSTVSWVVILIPSRTT